MKTNAPLVSVIIPAFNAASTIQSTLDSVLQQTFTDLEVIIVDDGSTDDTAEKVRACADRRIVYTYQPNSERAVARNNGIAHSRGCFCAFIDADDLWLPEKLEKQIPLLSSNPALGLVYCDLFQFDHTTNQNLTRFGKKEKFYRGKIDITKLLRVNFIQSPTPVVRRAALDQVGGFDSDLIPVEDWDLWIRIAYRYPIDFVGEPLARYRMHPRATSWENRPEEMLSCTFKLLRKTGVRYDKSKVIRNGIRLAKGVAYYHFGRSMVLDKQYTRALKAYLLSLRYYPTHIKTPIRISHCLALFLNRRITDAKRKSFNIPE
jgi:glycosyltransferase involved in cell wall biosynthesis